MLIIGGLTAKPKIHVLLVPSLIVGEESDRSVLFNNAVNNQAYINSGVYKLNLCVEQTMVRCPSTTLSATNSIRIGA